MKTLKLITLSLLFSITFFSCESDDDSSSSEPTTQELLAHKWFIKSVKPVGNPVHVNNDCEATSYYDFKSDGTFITDTFYVNSVTNECLSGGYYEGTYTLLDNNETIHVTLGSVSGNYTITTISTSELILTAPGEFVFFR